LISKEIKTGIKTRKRKKYPKAKSSEPIASNLIKICTKTLGKKSGKKEGSRPVPEGC
jgi:hypothetical protein